MSHHSFIRFIGLLGITLSLSACMISSSHLKTEVASFPSTPLDHNPNAPYQHIAVFATSVDDLIRKQNIEQAFCVALKPTPCNSMLSIFPPFRDYTSDEGLKRLTEYGIDAVLVISVNEDDTNPNSKGSNTYEVKQKSSITKDLKLIKSDPSTQAYLGQTQLGTKDVEESQTKVLPALARHSEGKVLLIDAQSGRATWGGAFETQGQGWGKIGNQAFAKSEATPITKALREAGLLGDGSRPTQAPSPQIIQWLQENPQSTKPNEQKPNLNSSPSSQKPNSNKEIEA